MAAEQSGRLRQIAKLLVALIVVGPLLVQLGFLGAEVAWTPDSETLVQLARLAIVGGVLALLVRQKRGSRGQQASKRAPEQAEDRTVEGSGEVYAPYAYNNQQEARREGERIRNRAEEVADAERDAGERR
jgi:membrane protein implicated in regulation of membrane protease activity